MRDELMTKIINLMMLYDIPVDEVKAKLFLIMEPYEITARTTEVAVTNDESADKYIKLFLLNKRVAGRTDRTLNLYNLALRMFFRECNKLPTEVTGDDIKLFLAVKEVRDGASKCYLGNLLRPISSFYAWMMREEHISRNPMNKVDNIKQPKTQKTAFTEMQIEQLRMTIRDEDIRLKLIFEMLLSTWCRISELTNMKISDISEDRNSVIVHGKGQKDRICYINAKAHLFLVKYLAERKDNSDWLFPKCAIKVAEGGICFAEACKHAKVKPYMWWKVPELISNEPADKSVVGSAIRELGKKAGVEHTHPHRFRRTGATFALRRGMPIEQVSKLLGHESIETTQIYLDISERELEQGHKKYVG
jgi:integrase/recombinase|nr:MAG TPA: SITE SPECIFIC RECOMBINASE XERD [Caudoviricetes sp.]